MNMQEFSTFMYNSDGTIKNISDINIYDILENGDRFSIEYKLALKIYNDETLRNLYNNIISKYNYDKNYELVIDKNDTLFENLLSIHRVKMDKINESINNCYLKVKDGKDNNDLWIRRFNYKFFKWEETKSLDYETDKQIDVIKIENSYIYKINWFNEKYTIISDKLFLDFNKEIFNIKRIFKKTYENHIVSLLQNELTGITCNVKNNGCSYDYKPSFNNEWNYRLGSFHNPDNIYLKPLHLVSFDFSKNKLYLTDRIEKISVKNNGYKENITGTRFNTYKGYILNSNGPILKIEQLELIQEMYEDIERKDSLDKADTVISLMFPHVADNIMKKPIQKSKRFF